MWLPNWAWLLLVRHLSSKHARPAVRWMNRFAFLGVTIGVFAWISVVSIMNGLQGEIREKIFQEKAHLLWEGAPRVGLEHKIDELKKTLGSEIKSSQLLLQTEGLLEIPNAGQRGRIAGSGVILQGVENFPPGVHLGIELAQALGAVTGDEIKLRSAWKLEGIPLQSKISGIFETGIPESDRSGVKINRKELESWLGLEGAVSRVEIQLQDPLKAPELVSEASRILELPLKTWKETHASLWYSLWIEKLFMTIVVFFIVVLAALAVHLALAVRVAEKTREIGLLRGLGASTRPLTRLYLTEGAAVGGVGSLLGLALSWLFCGLVAGYVKMPEFYYSTAIPVKWNWGTSLSLCGVSILAAILASLGPARRAGRCTASEALRS